MTKPFVVWFKEVGKDDVATVGGKGANLGEMTQAGFPVPPGFIITAQAYFHFLDEARLRDDLADLLHGLDVNDSNALERVSREIQHRITRARFPEDIAHEVIHAYFALEKGVLKHPLVAVRSSATAEDLPTASFAGQQATFLNVEGEANLLEKVKEAWASLFTARAIFYRVTNKFDHFKVGIAIPVQRMVQSDRSGVMFTIDPVTNDKSKIVIEAVLGLGEMIVQGSVTPDHYEVEKTSGRILMKVTHVQDKMMSRHGVKTDITALPKSQGGKLKLTDSEIVQLARIGQQLEKHYYFPQDSEWAIEKGKVFIVQTRPVTTTSPQKGARELSNVKKELLVKGDPASPGVASGHAKIIQSPKEIDKIKAGDVLVAPMTNPDFVPAMKRAVAIITERGGRTSHAAIVSRELGIPAVVGAQGALKALRDDGVVTVNGSTGEVFRGAITSHFVVTPAKSPARERVKTATNVYVNLAEPDKAREVASQHVDGVGLFRAEFMMAQIGKHPRKFIEEKKEKQFIEQLALGMETISEAFAPRPVVYRASDFRTNEFRNLIGGDRYEPQEDNPMLGFRGAARYIADPRVFQLELAALLEVRNKKNLKNLHLMIPFVRSPAEMLAVKKIVSASGLSRSASFKLWMMVELPTNVISIEEFLDVGIDGISFGSNDLTMLVLGTDRDNSEIAKDYNEVDPSLLWCYERVIRACVKRGVTTSMCGQAPSDFPDLVEKLVEWGVTSVSVNRDVLEHVRETVAAAEHKLVIKRSK